MVENNLKIDVKLSFQMLGVVKYNLIGNVSVIFQ